MSSSTNSLVPQYLGIVHSTQDALVLFEACLAGRLGHVTRRLHSQERKSLIKSGHIFIYEEHDSSIKRWTDGIHWSPSRLLGNFLVYRELHTQDGRKKRILKSQRATTRTSGCGIAKSISKGSSSFSTNNRGQLSPGEPDAAEAHGAKDDKNPFRYLFGSLKDSYDFKEPGGLVKKTISVNLSGVTHHIVNYYNIEDASTGCLKRPWADPIFRGMTIRAELYQQAAFRVPLRPDYYDEAGNAFISNVVGGPNFDSHHHDVGQLSISASCPVPNIHHFEGLGQAPSQVGSHIPSRFQGHSGGYLPRHLRGNEHQDGGYTTPMVFLSTRFSPHAPKDYHFHSNFHSAFNDNFTVKSQIGGTNTYADFDDKPFDRSHGALVNGGMEFQLEYQY